MPGPCFIFGALPVSAELLPKTEEPPFVIAADAGWQRAGELGLLPQLVVGDFDSSLPPPEGFAECIRLPAEKDDTDLHFAAKEALRRGFMDITLLGVAGGRFDQSLASLATLLHLRRAGAKARLLGEGLEVYCALPGESLVLQKRSGWYLSVFPAEGEAHGVFERGVRYPLENASLRPDFPLGVSNEFKDEAAEIACREAALFVLVVRHVF